MISPKSCEMKKMFGLLIGVIVLLQAANPQSLATVTAPVDNHKLFIEISGGMVWGPEESFSLGQAAIFFRWNKNEIRLEAEVYEELFKGLHYNTYSYAGLSYGQIFQKRKWDMGVHAGLGVFSSSYVEYQFRYDSTTTASTDKRTLGFKIDAEAVYQPKRFGIGTRLGINFNSLQNLGFGTMILRFRID